MMTLPDDHPEKWEYQEHTRAKHEILKYYLDVWTRIVSDERYKLRIFDCFAGRGDYETSDGAKPIPLETIQAKADYPGSPLIILDTVAQHTELFKETECYFLEPNDANRDLLDQNLDRVSNLPDSVSANLQDAEFANDIEEAISESGGRREFAFFFIDPFGLKDLDYNTVRDITRTSRFDCLITLMTKELIRWQNSEGHEDTFETLYGTPDWKEELQSYDANHLETAEAEYYCSRLEEGGTEYTLAYMTTRGDSIELMYDLVFTTNDDKGLEAMKGSMTRCGSDYALAYAPQRMDIGGPEQTTLTSGQIMTEEKRAKAYLVSRFAGRVISFDEVIQMVFADPERRYADSLRKDYRQYLKDLDREDAVEIPNRDSTGGPLPGDYVIHFPEMDEDKSTS